MSLIADALRKAEASPEYRRKETPAPPGSPPPRSPWLYRLVLAACAALVLLGITRVTRRAETPLAPVVTTPVALETPVPAPLPETPVPEPPPPPTELPVALNGILLSGDGRPLALINNEILQPGDRVRGMKIVRVNTDSVEMQDEDGETKTLKLRRED